MASSGPARSVRVPGRGARTPQAPEHALSAGNCSGDRFDRRILVRDLQEGTRTHRSPPPCPWAALPVPGGEAPPPPAVADRLSEPGSGTGSSRRGNAAASQPGVSPLPVPNAPDPRDFRRSSVTIGSWQTRTIAREDRFLDRDACLTRTGKPGLSQRRRVRCDPRQPPKGAESLTGTRRQRDRGGAFAALTWPPGTPPPDRSSRRLSHAAHKPERRRRHPRRDPGKTGGVQPGTVQARTGTSSAGCTTTRFAFADHRHAQSADGTSNPVQLHVTATVLHLASTPNDRN